MAAVTSFQTPVTLTFDGAPHDHVAMVCDPLLAVHALITSVFSKSTSSQPGLREAVFDALGHEGLAHYRYITTSTDRVFYPRVIVPTVDYREDWDQRAGDAIADVSSDVLVDQLVDMRRLEAGDGWEPVLDNPRRWLTGIAAAFTRVAVAARPWWTQAADRFAVEQARLDMVGTAPAALRHFVNDLSPEIRMDEDALRIKWSEQTHDAAGPRLTLIPTLVDSSYLILPSPAGTLYGYTMTAGARLASRMPSGRLQALLGRQRAHLLRQLDQPLTHTQLAEGAHIALSTVNHHVEKLRSAGLVVSMPLHRSHWVLRTAAGDGLLDLLD